MISMDSVINQVNASFRFLKNRLGECDYPYIVTVLRDDESTQAIVVLMSRSRVKRISVIFTCYINIKQGQCGTMFTREYGWHIFNMNKTTGAIDYSFAILDYSTTEGDDDFARFFEKRELVYNFCMGDMGQVTRDNSADGQLSLPDLLPIIPKRFMPFLKGALELSDKLIATHNSLGA